MLNWIALACLAGAALLLVALSVVDLKVRLLPNEMVAGFATLGLVFHITTLARFLPVPEIIAGGLTGFLVLYAVRFVANKIYQQDALGLGDVKLTGAAGLWLGPESVMMALSLGALAAMVHGLAYALFMAAKTRQKPDFARLQIPAGPGFAIGIALTGFLKFYNFFGEVL